MFKWIGWFFKILFFSLIVIIVANKVQVKGKTISDQVRTNLSHAERSEVVTRVKDWAGDLIQDVRQGIQARGSKSTHDAHSMLQHSNELEKPKALASRHSGATDKIDSSERQKLRALIDELNQPPQHN